MEFNKELVKLFIKHDVDARQWIKDEKWDEFYLTITSMYQLGELESDYSRECSLRVVIGNELPDLDISKFKQYWLKKYCGESAYSSDKETLIKLLKQYLSLHPTHTYSMICDAAKAYVDHCLAKGEYLMKADNFILDKDGRSRLEAAVEDLIDTKQLPDVWL